MNSPNILWLLVIGAVVGLFSGLLGIGGGVVAIPLMIYALKMSTKLAMGTSLAVIVPVAIAGSFKQYLQDHVNLSAALMIALSGIVFAYFGAWLNNRLPDLLLRRFFAVFMMLIGLKLLWNTLETVPPVLYAPGANVALFAPVVGYLLIGGLMGTLSGLLGIGGGIVAVPLLMFLMGMDAKLAMGTSLAVIVPVAISGSIKQCRQKNVNLKAAGLIALSGMFAAYLGAYLNHQLSSVWLERIFGAFLLLISAKMLLQTKLKTPEPVRNIPDVE